MLHRLPRILLAPHQNRVTPRRCPYRQLIQSQAFPTCLQDPCPRRRGEPQRRDAQFRDCQKAHIVRHGADGHEGFVRNDVACGLGAWGGEFDEAGEGERGAVNAGHEEPFEDDAVEGGVGAA